MSGRWLLIMANNLEGKTKKITKRTKRTKKNYNKNELRNAVVRGSVSGLVRSFFDNIIDCLKGL
jgi:hypothetical protein